MSGQKASLGISIAGGKGSLPYKDHDEVGAGMGEKKKRVHKTLYLCVFSYFFLSFQGIFISRVRKGGPSEKAGIHVGDRLLEVCSSHIIYFYSTIV